MKTNHQMPRRTVPVDWRSQEWAVAIYRIPVRHASHELSYDRSNPWPGSRPARSVVCPGPAVNPDSFMNHRYPYRSTRPQAFTLIEMLVVIAIIGILAGILLPVLGGMKTKAKIKQAQMEMLNLAAAIKAYEAEYHRFPSSVDAESKGKPDFTFGTTDVPQLLPQLPLIVTGQGYEANNSEVMFILLNHINQAPPILQPKIKNRNPRNLSFFDAKMVEDDAPGGIGTRNHIFRDPWGNPYIITIDLDDDNKSIDGYYCKFPGPGFVGNAAPYAFSGSLMIWSFGPDKQFGPGFDKDNVLSWKH